jgi:HD-like signal output (HDOD) protein
MSTSAMLSAELERRVLSCPRLPTLPAVALEVLRLCHAEEIDFWKLADALSSDPALAARVLRSANSASIAARGKVGTLSRAVPILGSSAVVAIALSFSLVRGRRRDDTGFDRSSFWRRAVFAAVAGRALAESSEEAVDPEEAFLAALLQDVGMLALAEISAEQYGAMCASAGGDHELLAKLEREAFEADHAAVGAILTANWNLPVSLQRAVAGSHASPPHDAAPSEARLIRCVALSGHLADVWVAPGEGALRPALEAARARLGFTETELEAVLARMALLIPETAGDFDIDLGGSERVEAVLAEARLLPAALGIARVAAEAGARVERGEALEGALRLAFDYARAHGESLALLEVVPDAQLPVERSTALVGLLRRCVRATDLVGPLDAERVLLLLPQSDLAAATAVAGRLLARISAGGPRLALSVGVACATAGTGSLAQLRAAAAAGAAAAHARGGSQVAAASSDARAEHKR